MSTDHLPEWARAIEAREHAATKGPWAFPKHSANLCAPDADEETYDGVIWGPDGGPVDADAAFIATARADVPRLLANLAVAVEALDYAWRTIEAAHMTGDWLGLDGEAEKVRLTLARINAGEVVDPRDEPKEPENDDA